MKLSISRWRPGHVFAAWAAYWVALAVATLTPAIYAIARVAGSKGNVSLSFGDWMLKLTVSVGGAQTYVATGHVLPISLWIAVPPLALYALWLRARSRARARSDVAPDQLPPPGVAEWMPQKEREGVRRS